MTRYHRLLESRKCEREGVRYVFEAVLSAIIYSALIGVAIWIMP